MIGDELTIILDVGELPGQADPGSVAARLPANASGIASAVTAMLAAPQPVREPVAVRSVTIRLTRTRVVAAETLMLDGETQIYP